MTDTTTPRIEIHRPHHRDGVAALVVQIQREEFGIPITLADQPDLLDVAGFYQQGLGQFWVATAGERVVGTIGLRDIGEGNAALRKMFVAADHRGPRHGLAAALMRTLLEHARTHGIRTIWLGTTAAFLAAHRFYEKHGFSRIDPEELPTAFPRMSVDSRFYRISP